MDACAFDEFVAAMDGGSSVTLIFYRISDRWWKEPFLNLVAATAQFSSLTHVELAIGEEVGSGGTMANVCRVFNDAQGVVELCRSNHRHHL